MTVCGFLGDNFSNENYATECIRMPNLFKVVREIDYIVHVIVFFFGGSEEKNHFFFMKLPEHAR